MKTYPHAGRILSIIGGSGLLVCAVAHVVIDRHVSLKAWELLASGGAAVVAPSFGLKRKTVQPLAPNENAAL